MTDLPADNHLGSAPLAGGAAVEVYRHDAATDAVIELVGSILAHSYSLFLGDRGRAFITEVYAHLAVARAREADLQELARVERARFAGMGLARSTAYKTASLRRTIHLLRSMVRLRGDIVDVGAGLNQLGESLMAEEPAVTQVIGLDVLEPPDARAGDRLLFVRQTDPEELPLADASADIAIFRFSLHHMNFRTQAALLADVRRVLRPGGSMLVVEDTFSLAGAPLVATRLLDAFSSLPFVQRISALACLDASSCFVEEETMPFAFGFRSLEGWVELLREAGYRDTRTIDWGLPMFSLYQAPLGLVVGKAP